MTQAQQDVIEVLTHDHREVEQMFAQLEGLRGQTDDTSRQKRKELVDNVIIELVRHSVAEETAVYPQVQAKVSADEAERAKHEHGEAEETMKALDGMDPDDPRFELQLETLMREIREHVAEEEGEIFPHMRTIFSEQELVDMAGKVARVKKIAPTRPHPGVPHERGARAGHRPGRGPVRPAARRRHRPGPRRRLTAHPGAPDRVTVGRRERRRRRRCSTRSACWWGPGCSAPASAPAGCAGAPLRLPRP